MAYWGEIEFSTGTPNIAENYTPVTAYFYAVSDNGSAWKNDTTYASLSLDGTSESSSVGAYNFRNNKKLLLGSITKNVTHNTDGTKTVYASFSWNAGHSLIGTVTRSDSLGLTPIPRYADFTEHYISNTGLNSITVHWNADAECDAVEYSINGGNWQLISGLTYTITGLSPGTQYNIRTAIKRKDSQLWTESSVIYGTTKKIATVTGANNFNSNENPYMTFTNESGSVINARLEFGGVSIQRNGIANTGAYSFVLTEVERNLLYSKCPNSNTLTVRYVIATVVGGTETYLHFLDRTMTVVNSNPIFSNFSFKDIGEVSTQLTGNNQTVINGYNVMEITVTSANKAVAQNGATITKYRAVCGNVDTKIDYSTNSDATMTLGYITNRTIIVYAIDSRGNSTAVTKSIENWKDYSNIVIKSASASRTGGVDSETRLILEGELWNSSFGTVLNAITNCTYKYKKTNATNYTESDMQITTTVNNNKFTVNMLIKGDLEAKGFNVQSSYNILITVTDKIRTATFALILGTGVPAMAIHKNGVAFGRPYDENIGGHLQLDGERVIVNNIGFCKMSVSGAVNHYNENKIVDHFGHAISSNGFIANTEASRLEIPKGIEAIEVTGQLCGCDPTFASILIKDTKGNYPANYNYQQGGILIQSGGNGYWKQCFTSGIVQLDKTKKYYVQLEVSPYNCESMGLNNGFGEYASWIQAKKIS